MKNHCFILFALGVTATASGQTTYQHLVDIPESTMLGWSGPSADGGSWMSFNDGTEAVLQKFDPAGQPIWCERILRDSLGPLNAIAWIETSGIDGSLFYKRTVGVSSFWPYTSEVDVVRIDSDGSLAWKKTLILEGDLYQVPSIGRLFVRPDGRCLLSEIVPGQNLLVQFDPSGQVEWSKAYSDGPYFLGMIANLVPDGTDGWYGCFSTPDMILSRPPAIVHFLGDGSIDWCKSIAFNVGFWTFHGNNIALLPGGDLLVTGSATNMPDDYSFTMRMTGTGEVSWFKLYDMTLGGSIQEEVGGDLLIGHALGYTRLDAVGNVLAETFIVPTAYSTGALDHTLNSSGPKIAVDRSAATGGVTVTDPLFGFVEVIPYLHNIPADLVGACQHTLSTGTPTPTVIDVPMSMLTISDAGTATDILPVISEPIYTVETRPLYPVIDFCTVVGIDEVPMDPVIGLTPSIVTQGGMVEITGRADRFRLVDGTGRVCMELPSESANANTFSTADLAPGHYTLMAEGATVLPIPTARLVVVK